MTDLRASSALIESLIEQERRTLTALGPYQTDDQERKTRRDETLASMEGLKASLIDAQAHERTIQAASLEERRASAAHPILTPFAESGIAVPTVPTGVP